MASARAWRWSPMSRTAKAWNMRLMRWAKTSGESGRSKYIFSPAFAVTAVKVLQLLADFKVGFHAVSSSVFGSSDDVMVYTQSS